MVRAGLTAAVKHVELRPVFAGVFDAFTGGLRYWALALGGMGVVLASAASSMASQVEIDQVGRRIWAWLREPARSWKAELLGAALLTTVGVLAVLRPIATLQAATVVSGALLAFEGLRRFFILVPPGSRKPRNRPNRRWPRRARPAGPRAPGCIIRWSA